MEEEKKNCRFCHKEFFFDKKKRKSPKYCSLECYRLLIRSADISVIQRVINMAKRLIMNEKELAKNIGIGIGILIAIILMWMLIF